MINKTAPFPQANDFKKILDILNIENEAFLKDYNHMRIYLNDISERQVDYYITACIYLGLMEKNKTFSTVGNDLRNKSGIDQIAALIQIVVSDECFGIVYFKQKLLGIELDKLEIVDIMREYVTFDSEAMYERRASTISSWIRWIIEHEE